MGFDLPPDDDPRRLAGRAWLAANPGPPGPVDDIVGARILAEFGDSITTDHISPAGSIKASSPAGEWLQSRQVRQQDFNSYGSRRGNDDVMVRGTFANIRIRNEMLGGKEGGNRVSLAAVEAARLSRATNAPVHVSWDREEEFHNYVRPMTHHQLTARLSDGRIEALDWREASGDSVIGLAPEFMGRVLGFDPGAARGAWIYYNIPNHEITAWRRRMPLPTGQWRGLGYMPNSFPIESFIDEAAHAAGRDPLQFRLDHLPDDAFGRRMAAVLNAAAERARWGEPAPPGHGRGIACCVYHGTVTAEVVDISLDEATGQIRLHRVVAALDCGRAINPDQVRGQVEGSIVMGASNALMEQLTVKDGRLEAASFANYPFFTMMEAPEIETILLEPPGREPSGVGEPPIGPVAPAIANALFALSGVRMRRLPMTQERVLRALAEREPNGVIVPS